MNTYQITIDKSASIRLSAYGLVLVFIGAALFRQLTGGNGLESNALLMLMAALGAIGVHELIHGIFFKLFGGKVRYGVGLKYYLLPYAYATSPGTVYTFRQMTIIGLAPFVFLSLLLVGLAFLTPSLTAYWSVAFIINFGGAVGDLWLMSRIRKFRRISNVYFIDKADGIEVASRSEEVAKVAAQFKHKQGAFFTTVLNTWMASTLILLVLTILVSGTLHTIAPQQSFVIGTDQFFIAKYTKEIQGTTATLELTPVILGGLIFSILFMLLQKKTHRRRA